MGKQPACLDRRRLQSILHLLPDGCMLCWSKHVLNWQVVSLEASYLAISLREVCVCGSQQWSGVNAVSFFAPQIFSGLPPSILTSSLRKGKVPAILCSLSVCDILCHATHDLLGACGDEVHQRRSEAFQVHNGLPALRDAATSLTSGGCRLSLLTANCHQFEVTQA